MVTGIVPNARCPSNTMRSLIRAFIRIPGQWLHDETSDPNGRNFFIYTCPYYDQCGSWEPFLWFVEPQIPHIGDLEAELVSIHLYRYETDYVTGKRILVCSRGHGFKR